jgi:CLIP-associating protein 1/2
MTAAMEGQIASLQVLMHGNGNVDHKIAGITEIKKDIKHYNVPRDSVPALFEILRMAVLQHGNATLFSTGFSAIGHLLKRLNLQDYQLITAEVPKLLPFLTQELGDVKERHRLLASQCLMDCWKSSPANVETAVRDTALSGHNVRAKISGLQWLTKMTAEGLTFRSFVPKLMDALSDADGTVRDTAKQTVVDIFQYVLEFGRCSFINRRY